MRVRSRTAPALAGSHYPEDTDFTYTYHPEWNFSTHLVRDTRSVSCVGSTSTIADWASPANSAKRKKNVPLDSFGKRLAVLDTDSGATRSITWGAKQCDHASVKTRFEKNLLVIHQRVNSAGSPIYERTDTRTLRFDHGLQLVKWYSPDVDAILNQHSTSWTAPFLNHDWFALTDKFNEMCDQYMPSSMFLGESMVEHELFVDALKLVLNPSSAIQFLLKRAKGLKHLRKMSFGRAARHIAKESTNSYLTYTFGIRPAVKDVLDALHAHDKVSKRLQHLRQAAGQFVPIRARQKLDSELSETPPSFLTDNLAWYDDQHVSTACITGLGRVRDDIAYSGDWAAYLQYFGINKVVGLAWELIPFSFVVDWFTNAQERINSLTRLRFGGPFVEFRNISHSVKKLHREKLIFSPVNDHSFGGLTISPSSDTIVAYRDTIEYHRRPGIPDTSGVLDFSALGLFHAISGAGLIIQRI